MATVSYATTVGKDLSAGETQAWAAVVRAALPDVAAADVVSLSAYRVGSRIAMTAAVKKTGTADACMLDMRGAGVLSYVGGVATWEHKRKISSVDDATRAAMVTALAASHPSIALGSILHVRVTASPRHADVTYATSISAADFLATTPGPVVEVTA